MRVSLILVRHGHVEGIDTPQFRGRTHLALTASGQLQAEQTGEYIHRIAPHPARIYSSPLTRCVTTGTIIGRGAGLVPLPRAGLNDIDYGAWQGRLVSEVSRESPEAVAAWFHSPAQAKIPGGETLQSVAERVRRAIGAIVEENAGATVIVVGHDSVNRVILLQALGLPLDAYWRIAQRPGAVNRLEFQDGVWSIESLNETAHLLPTRGHAV